MPLIPKAYLYAGAAILAVILLLAVAASYKIAYDKGNTAGQDKCKASVATATAENLAKSQKGIINATKKLQSVEDEINKSPLSDDGPIARVLADQLVRMRGEPEGIANRNANPKPASP